MQARATVTKPTNLDVETVEDFGIRARYSDDLVRVFVFDLIRVDSRLCPGCRQQTL